MFSLGVKSGSFDSPVTPSSGPVSPVTPSSGPVSPVTTSSGPDSPVTTSFGPIRPVSFRTLSPGSFSYSLSLRDFIQTYELHKMIDDKKDELVKQLNESRVIGDDVKSFYKNLYDNNNLQTHHILSRKKLQDFFSSLDVDKLIEFSNDQGHLMQEFFMEYRKHLKSKNFFFESSIFTLGGITEQNKVFFQALYCMYYFSHPGNIFFGPKACFRDGDPGSGFDIPYKQDSLFRHKVLRASNFMDSRSLKEYISYHYSLESNFPRWYLKSVGLRTLSERHRVFVSELGYLQYCLEENDSINLRAISSLLPFNSVPSSKAFPLLFGHVWDADKVSAERYENYKSGIQTFDPFELIPLKKVLQHKDAREEDYSRYQRAVRDQARDLESYRKDAFYRDMNAQNRCFKSSVKYV